MQTFVPIATTDYAQIAKVLDNKRLNKQALEGWQILLNLYGLDPEGNERTPRGWSNHPAVKMWRGYEVSLYSYVIAMTNEWIDRGYKSTIGMKATQTMHSAILKGRFLSSEMPDWMRDPEKFKEIASSHRTALLAKDYAWYSQFNWDEDNGYQPDTYEYVWG